MKLTDSSGKVTIKHDTCPTCKYCTKTLLITEEIIIKQKRIRSDPHSNVYFHLSCCSCKYCHEKISSKGEIVQKDWR